MHHSTAFAAALGAIAAMLAVAALAQDDASDRVQDSASSADAAGIMSSISTSGRIDTRGACFQSLGSNGRAVRPATSSRRPSG